MSPFNPRILEASVQDVMGYLSDTQKANVLLCALQQLPIQGCHTVVENAVQSILKVPDWSSDNTASALLLRAKGRLAAGQHAPAQRDLHSVLAIDPQNQDAKAALRLQHKFDVIYREPDRSCRFPDEVWQQIALFLPKRDLKTLSLVSNALSRLSSQLLFRDIELYFTTVIEPPWPGTVLNFCKGEDAWHNERSAYILTRMLADTHFAWRVKDLSVFATPDEDGNKQFLTFKVGMLLNVLPKLLNLRHMHYSGDKGTISRVLQVAHSLNPRLQRLSLVSTDGINVPDFKHITHLAMGSLGGNESSIQAFLSQNRDTLRYLSINNPKWSFPIRAISIRHLTQIQFNGLLTIETFSEILTNGHQLESLMLSGTLQCTPSSLFRQLRGAFQFLRHFSLIITGASRKDRDFCPAVSDVVRELTQLRTYHFCVPPSVAPRIGFDASCWSVLPALPKLNNLAITYPKDMPAVLAGWLIPRTARAVTLDLSAAGEGLPDFVNRLHIGMPPELRYFGITNPVTEFTAVNIIEHGSPNLRVVRIKRSVWTVTRSERNGPYEIEKWPTQRIIYAAKWLESLGCEDALWQGVNGPIFF